MASSGRDRRWFWLRVVLLNHVPSASQPSLLVHAILFRCFRSILRFADAPVGYSWEHVLRPLYVLMSVLPGAGGARLARDARDAAVQAHRLAAQPAAHRRVPLQQVQV